MNRVLVSAGEPSGDIHAAAVASELASLDPTLAIEAVGGRALRDAGAQVIADLQDLSAMGTVEALHSAKAHWKLLRRLDRRLAEGAYRAVLLVDYPGFHLRVARRAAARGIPVVYYIAPQLWAWGAWRARELRATVRQLAVILPFEEAYFRAHGIPCTFVGHPLLDQPTAPDRAAARQALGIDRDAPVLALFPGRRRIERDRMWNPFCRAASLLRDAVPGLRVLIAAAQDATPGFEGAVWSEEPRSVFAAADAALCKSGTSTLEAALAGTPMVIAYRAHPLSYWLARRLLQVSDVGLVNLVAGHRIAPELLQGAAEPERLRDALLPLFDPTSDAARGQTTAFEPVRSRLGEPGAARRVAELVIAEAA